MAAGSYPVDASAERELEARQRGTYNRVAVPGMKLGVGDQPIWESLPLNGSSLATIGLGFR